MKLILAALTAAASLSACGSYSAQTTSGADYLARYDGPKAAAQQVVTRTTKKDGSTVEEIVTPEPSLEELIRQAAAVEPLLKFPARIGLARIENGAMTAIPVGEFDVWFTLVQAHGDMGTFVPVDPFVAEYTAQTVISEDRRRSASRATDAVNRIRLGAARQHIDAVLIYEVGAKATKENTALALADLTVLGGAFLPTRAIDAEGRGRALLMDVRNGYPYGTAQATAALSRKTGSWGSDEETDALREAATLKVTRELAREVEAMMGQLVMQTKAREVASN